MKINIIGGGFSGMTLAWRLAKLGISVEIYEASPRLGGMLQTHQSEFGLIESAANAVMSSVEIQELFADIGFTPVSTLSDSKRRFIFRGKPLRWPLFVSETLGLLPAAMKLIFRGKKSLRPQAGQTVKDWSDRHFSSAFTEFLLSPALQGIYAGDVSKMSASLVFGPLLTQPKSGNVPRGMLSGKHGMQELIDHLGVRLQQLNVKINLMSSVNLADLSGPVVIATSVRAAEKLLQNRHETSARKLRQISVAPILSMTSFWARQTKYRGFGVLIPNAFGLRTLGVLMNSFIFPFRTKSSAVSETYIWGGPLRPSPIELSDSEIVIQVEQERQKIFGENSRLLHYQITRWPEGLPQYDLKLESVLKDLSLPEGIHLHGNYLGQIGLTKILKRSYGLAEELKALYG